jgi:outer membrane receptor protein involved in Fe transport
VNHLSVTPSQRRPHPRGAGQSALLKGIACLLPLSTWTGNAFAQEANTALEEVTVRATLLNAGVAPVSATVLTEHIQSRRGAAHLEDVITLAPNVAASSGASRSRFFQIRGIGERSQFVEPVNPSVGILLDGIDLSGAGGALTLFDVRQVEVLRGPQGTLMGANALAGLIAVQSNGTDSDMRDLSVGVENKSGYRLGARWSGHLTDSANGRIAVQQYESDGYVDNDHLSRSDTNAREELTVRGTLTWTRDTHTIEAAAYYTRVDNGYDAFSLDNTRATLSDQPGEDDLTLKAGRLNWQSLLLGLDSTLQLSHASTETTYSYDEDWSYLGIAPGWEYSSYDQYLRDRSMNSLEWRLQAPEAYDTDWVIGTYLRDESEDLSRRYSYLPAPFASEIDTQTLAVFGQVNRSFSEQLSGFIGARLEQRDSEYRDSAGVAKDFDHNYWTGRLGMIWQYHSDAQLYATLSRGARAGGANAGLLASIDALPEQSQDSVAALGVFDEETLVSLELGWQLDWTQYDLRSRLALFTMDRDDQQAKGSLVIPRADGSTAFIDYTDNAAASEHRGLEWELQWLPTRQVVAALTLGLLDAQFDRYITATGADLSGRDQPQAPDWQYSAGFTWHASTLASVQLEVAGSDSYFFSDRHDVRAPETHQLNASLSGQWRRWRWTLWGRNLTDETTFVRGFGTFGNDPRKEYALEPYRQYGEPRMVGLSLSYDLTESQQ